MGPLKKYRRLPEMEAAALDDQEGNNVACWMPGPVSQEVLCAILQALATQRQVMDGDG